jgi:hypothetical protein
VPLEVGQEKSEVHAEAWRSARCLAVRKIDGRAILKSTVLGAIFRVHANGVDPL